MKNYPTQVIIGMQWGDEGKGKISDYLAHQVDVVVRFQGGNNAGHSISFNGKKFALNHIPSGIFNPRVVNVMSQGMVINPKQLLREINILKDQGINDFQLLISDRAHIIMPYHLDLDAFYEKTKGAIASTQQIGTTKKGIGPAYVDKISRIGIRMGDFINLHAFERMLTTTLAIKNKQLEAFGLKPYEVQTLVDDYKAYANIFKPYVSDTGLFLETAIQEQKQVLFEGAQGTMLCLENGSYPFVTSSSPTSASVPLSAGVRPHYINKVIGVVKAYSTRVGGGYMPTELSLSEEMQRTHIQTNGNEFGTVTKRPRRIGWLDIVALKHAIRISGVNEIALTLLDVLSGMKIIKIATSYSLDGHTIDYIPGSIFTFEKCRPKYISLPGWNENISNVKSFLNLPIAAKNYVHKIEELTGIKVSIVSVGPSRKQTIVINGSKPAV